MLVNLTPHPIRIYPPETPDHINPHQFAASWTLPATERPARFGQVDLGTNWLDGCDVPVEYVEYARLVNPLPEENPGTWYVVPLVVALVLAYGGSLINTRGDLLVPYREVRNEEGTVIGCRGLARPV